ncbi:hypothetical protein DSO57_1017330 [Entomophthora muscae]|uniref:Uncharacterized protein n=1 Tax=Entomophthora muscae TaxID=34485 RepID=A0ACC2RVX8_9FUNG|nr:hypothetical protein DSO57_1017330 [Entomophthora muscae]
MNSSFFGYKSAGLEKIWLMKLILVLVKACASLDGIVYTGFSGGCPSAREVEADVGKIRRHTNQIRMYGNECGQVNNALGAISRQNLDMKVLVGLWTRDNKLDQNCDSLIQLLKRNPSYQNHIVGVTVGNEDVYSGIPSGVVAGNIRSVRAKFGANGLGHISVSTAEVGHMWNQELAAASDVIYANIYSFFSAGNNNINDAANAITLQADNLRSKFGKPIVIAETGWPSGGNYPQPHFAEPSLPNQKRFLEILDCTARGKGYRYFVLEAFDNSAKGAPGSVERNFGVLDPSGNLKSGALSPRC